ncbi:MAG: hypothetical protein ABJL44_18460 [Algibacter sp.]
MKKKLIILFLMFTMSFVFSQGSNGLHPSVKIDIPNNFSKLSTEAINKKYTIPTNRPTVAYASPDNTASISYHHTQNLLPKERVKELRDLLVQQFGAAKMQILSNEIKVLNKNEVVFIEMIAPSYTEGNIYNIITATNLDDRMLLISFSCSEILMPKWRDKAFKILESLKISQ